MLRRLLACLGFVLAFFTLAAPAVAAPSDVQTTWRLLDYVAVDYAGAVRGGKVISTSEYAEMRGILGVGPRRCCGATPTLGEIEPRSRSAGLRFAGRTESAFRAGRDRCPLARRAPPCRLSCAARAQAGARPRARGSPVPGNLRELPWRERRCATAMAGSSPAADRVLRPQPGEGPKPVRALSGHQPGPRRHRDAELRATARCRQMGACLPGEPLRLSRRPRAPGQEHLAVRRGGSLGDPRPQCVEFDVREPARREDRGGEGRCGHRLSEVGPRGCRREGVEPRPRTRAAQ